MPELDPFRPANLDAPNTPVSPSTATRPPRKNAKKPKKLTLSQARKAKGASDAAIKDAVDNVIRRSGNTKLQGEIEAIKNGNLPRRGRKPREAAPAKVRKPRVAKVAKSGKLGINEIVQATIGLKADEAKALLSIHAGISEFNKKGRAKIVAALAKLFA